MSGHDDVLRYADELEAIAKDLHHRADAMLNKVDAMRTAHCRAIMRQSERQTASPRVVAGPLRLVEAESLDAKVARARAQIAAGESTPIILTHPTCAIPCASCDDDGRPDGEAA